ncbi:MAG: hypothetical protein OSJ55_08105 [Bacteroidales bacterium]|nr:hypothetical protein [Bacteroidales bacterium]
MKKQDIIHDFASLKGLSVIPETEPVYNKATKSSKPQPKSTEPEPKQKTSALKAGQKVVMMDCDLRGKIVSVNGNKVTIELEDGFEIESSRREFAVTEESELSSLKQANAKTSKSVEPRKVRNAAPPNTGTLTVDLHIESIPGWKNVPEGQQLQFQLDHFKRIIRENLPHKGMKISFIHGIGDGVLKAAIRKELTEVLALKCTYSVGDPAVTVVTIR